MSINWSPVSEYDKGAADVYSVDDFEVRTEVLKDLEVVGLGSAVPRYGRGISRIRWKNLTSLLSTNIMDGPYCHPCLEAQYKVSMYEGSQVYECRSYIRTCRNQQLSFTIQSPVPVSKNKKYGMQNTVGTLLLIHCLTRYCIREDTHSKELASKLGWGKATMSRFGSRSCSSEAT